MCSHFVIIAKTEMTRVASRASELELEMVRINRAIQNAVIVTSDNDTHAHKETSTAKHRANHDEVNANVQNAEKEDEEHTRKYMVGTETTSSQEQPERQTQQYYGDDYAYTQKTNNVKPWGSSSYLDSLSSGLASVNVHVPTQQPPSRLELPKLGRRKETGTGTPIDLLYTTITTTSSSLSSSERKYSAHSGYVPEQRYSAFRFSSSASNSNRMAFLRQTMGTPTVEAEINLRALEKLMEAKVELSTELAVESVVEKTSETVAEGMIEEAIRQFQRND